MVELEIPGIRPPECYDKEIMCDIPDPKSKRLDSIPENKEFDSWQDDFDSRFESASRNINTDGRRRSSH